MLYPWQRDDWHRLTALRDRLPHALLLHGQQGIGKRDLALHFAQGLLCESALPDGQPCNTCSACHWFGQGNHPDFTVVRPEALEAGAGEAEGDGESSSKKKAPSKIIRMEQVRALIEAVGVGTHRAGLRVVVVYPLDALQTEGANALLKTLEEPPPSTVFLLVTDRLDRVLPTILSRCRQFSMTRPTGADALDWLRGQGVADVEAQLALAGGAPLTALHAAEAEEQPLQRWLVGQLGSAAALDALAAAEQLQKLPVPAVLGILQRWTYDLLALCLGTGAARYFPKEQTALARCASATDAHRLQAFAARLVGHRRNENHPLAARLVMESVLLDYRQLFR
ncbi:MAG: DNA polymerase III subunit delta' [Burkholderiaceae bacterium]|uniref:DNA polymerase III subunit delta n=1 Tax=Cupriavidus metallidurans TaxID=119219 RepID=A0A482IQL3_9BURK|nr:MULTISPECIES: DNA polymerase III subunit delta' [Cupriavidus]KWR78206.1 DNA polymerase III subunit delta' [Cupriavidus sp. SHE]PCH58712.1 MAG: DNA polymerase III subunit delta' [Burkholderiaceae bacterium]QBP09807.1 DNA polymerase III subunit delta' [Cupriavidus metallidurans]QWC90143.1 DNA polymerase III subunit delta' [Cupriavidus metallidurans]